MIFKNKDIVQIYDASTYVVDPDISDLFDKLASYVDLKVLVESDSGFGDYMLK